MTLTIEVSVLLAVILTVDVAQLMFEIVLTNGLHQ